MHSYSTRFSPILKAIRSCFLAMTVFPATHWSRCKRPRVFWWSRKEIKSHIMLQCAWFVWRYFASQLGSSFTKEREEEASRGSWSLLPPVLHHQRRKYCFESTFYNYKPQHCVVYSWPIATGTGCYRTQCPRRSSRCVMKRENVREMSHVV